MQSSKTSTTLSSDVMWLVSNKCGNDGDEKLKIAESCLNVNIDKHVLVNRLSTEIFKNSHKFTASNRAISGSRL